MSHSEPLIGGEKSKHVSLAEDQYSSITPRDEYNGAYLSFLLLGAGFLFPWNAVITAVGFFTKQYSDPGIEFAFSVAYMCPNLLGLVFVVQWGHLWDFFKRIKIGLCIFLVVMAALPFLKSAAIGVTLVGILGLSDAIVQGSIYGLAGQFHPRFVGAVMSGNGVAGVTVCALRIVTKLVIPAGANADLISAVLYFGLAALVCVACIIVTHYVLERSRVTKFYMAKSDEERLQYITKLTQTGQNISVATGALYASAPAPASGAVAAQYGLSMAHDAPGAADKAMAEAEEGSEPSTSVGMVSGPSMQQGSVKEVFGKVWPMAIVVAFNFLVTLALFPGLTSQMTSRNFSDESGWYPIIWITLFNSFDFIGRTAPRWDAAIFIGPGALWLPTVLRVVFVPAFIFCLHHLYFFTSDFMGYLCMSLMALSNGYCGTLAMMYGPARVDAINKERAGTIMVFFLTAGLTGGVWLGVLFNGLFGQDSSIVKGGYIA